MAQLDRKEINDMRNEAWDNHLRGENIKAIKLYNKLIEIDPLPAVDYSQRAAAYIDLKDYEQAINDCDIAVKIKPSYYYSYNKTARLQ